MSPSGLGQWHLTKGARTSRQTGADSEHGAADSRLLTDVAAFASYSAGNGACLDADHQTASFVIHRSPDGNRRASAKTEERRDERLGVLPVASANRIRILARLSAADASGARNCAEPSAADAVARIARFAVLRGPAAADRAHESPRCRASSENKLASVSDNLDEPLIVLIATHWEGDDPPGPRRVAGITAAGNAVRSPLQ